MCKGLLHAQKGFAELYKGLLHMQKGLTELYKGLLHVQKSLAQLLPPHGAAPTQHAAAPLPETAAWPG